MGECGVGVGEMGGPENKHTGTGDRGRAPATVMLLDANSLVHRAYHALPPLTSRSGQPTNAVQGFANMLLRLLGEQKPEFVVAAFDRPEPTFRHEEFEGYKATRAKTPDDLASQFELVRRMLACMNIPILEAPGYEADDILGTVAARARQAGHRALVVTGDKDALQLVDEHTRVMLTRKGISEMDVYGPDEVAARTGLSPAQLVDLKALVGDASDNIPGVAGIGEKTAARLVAEFGSLEGILDRLDSVEPERVRDLLRSGADQARRSRRLATIVRDVPVDVKLEDYRARQWDYASLMELLNSLDMKMVAARVDRMRQAAAPALPTPAPEAAAATTPRGATASAAAVAAQGRSTLQGRLELDVRAGEAPAPPSAVASVEDAAGVAAAVQALLALRPGADRPVVLAFALGGADPMRAEPAWVAAGAGEQAAAGGDGRGAVLSGAFAARLDRMEPGEARTALDALRPLLEDPGVPKVLHGAKPVVVALARRGVDLRGLEFDGSLASYLVDPGAPGHGLPEACRAHMGSELTGCVDSLGQVADPAVALGVTWELAARLASRLHADGSDALFRDVEVPLVRVLAGMEVTGVAIDTRKLAGLSTALGERAQALEREIFELVGEEFNINSPKQLASLLFDKLGLPPVRKTKTGYSTDAEVLEELAPRHVVVRKILDYRQVIKLKSTYADALPLLVNPETGRIHTTFNQTVTATGRLSSTDPNLQNIPVRTEEGRKIREVFVPGDPGWVLVSADYSQIELRILAHISGDEELVRAFKAREDIHARTAARVLGLASVADVTPAMRERAKAVNFGIVYGISDYGLARQIGVSRGEARAFIDSYFTSYPGVKAYVERIVQDARRDGYVTTLLNRRRYLPDLTSPNPAVRKFAERTAMNTPIQGSAADIIKVAMVRMSDELRRAGLAARMLLQVHDELVFEAPEAEVEELATLARGVMEGAASLSVPLVVDVKVGPNWADMRKLNGVGSS